jgi:hypothetical protein
MWVKLVKIGEWCPQLISAKTAAVQPAKISFCYVITDNSATRKQLRLQNKKISQSGELLVHGYSNVP